MVPGTVFCLPSLHPALMRYNLFKIKITHSIQFDDSWQCIQLCSHHHNQDRKHFHYLRKSLPVPLQSVLLSSFFVTIVFPFLKCHISKPFIYILSIWLFSTNVVATRFILVLPMSVGHSFLLLSSIPLYEYVHFTYSVAESHWVVTFWDDMNVAAMNIHIQVLCVPMFLFLLGKYLWMGLLVRMGSIFLTL